MLAAMFPTKLPTEPLPPPPLALPPRLKPKLAIPPSTAAAAIDWRASADTPTSFPRLPVIAAATSVTAFIPPWFVEPAVCVRLPCIPLVQASLKACLELSVDNLSVPIECCPAALTVSLNDDPNPSVGIILVGESRSPPDDIPPPVAVAAVCVWSPKDCLPALPADHTSGVT